VVFSRSNRLILSVIYLTPKDDFIRRKGMEV
jgi:hypothetical protein